MSLLSGIISGLTSALDPLGLFPGSPSGALTGDNGLLTNPTGAWDKFKNGMTNDVNYKIAQENLEYQRERNEIEDERYEEETTYNRAFAEDERDYQRAFAEDERAYQREFAENERDYQRQLQQEIFNREDTALERQANSLSKLGINPLSQNMNGLGAGQAVSASVPGSASAGSASAPGTSSRGGSALHNDFQMQDTGLLGAITPLMSLFQGASDMYTGSITRDGLREQNDYQRLLNQEKEIENRFKEIRLQKELDNLTADTENKEANTKTTNELREHEVKDKKASAERNERENAFQNDFGVTDNTNAKVRLYTDIANLSDKAGFTSNENRTVDYTKGKVKDNADNLKNAFGIVSKALSNTIGKSAKAIYGTFSRLGEKAKKRSEESKTYYYDENGKRRRMYNTYVDDRL